MEKEKKEVKVVLSLHLFFHCVQTKILSALQKTSGSCHLSAFKIDIDMISSLKKPECIRGHLCRSYIFYLNINKQIWSKRLEHMQHLFLFKSNREICLTLIALKAKLMRLSSASTVESDTFCICLFAAVIFSSYLVTFIINHFSFSKNGKNVIFVF